MNPDFWHFSKSKLRPYKEGIKHCIFDKKGNGTTFTATLMCNITSSLSGARQRLPPPPPSRRTTPLGRGAACGAPVGRTDYKREREESGSPDLEFAFTSASHGLELQCAATRRRCGARSADTAARRAITKAKRNNTAPSFPPPSQPSANRGKNARPYSAEKKRTWVRLGL